VIDRSRRIAPHRAVFVGPGQTGDVLGVIEILEQVQDQLLTISPADEIDLGALLLDSIGVERGKDSPESQGDFGKFAAKKACQDLGIGIGSGGQEAQPYEVGLDSADLLDDMLIRRIGVRLVEHGALVPIPLEHCRQRHDADGWEADDLG